MDPIILASIILSGSLFVTAAIVAFAMIRSRREAVPPPSDQLALDAWRDTLDRLERRVGKLEAAVRSGAGATPTLVMRPESEPLGSTEVEPLSVHAPPPLAVPVKPIAPPVPEVVPSTKRTFRAAEICKLAQRGRNPVEIAQLLGADVGEVELVLQLEKAARAELT